VACGAAPQDESVKQADYLECVMDVLYDKGVDHAEGMTLFFPVGGTARLFLVVYDSASGIR
jgi:hypothetical protein